MKPFIVLIANSHNLSQITMSSSNSTPHHSAANPSAKFKGTTMTIQPRDLNIVWGNDSRYWSIPDKKDLPAELFQVSWLEVTGVVDETSAKKSYEVGFRVSLNPDAFGWGNYPIYIMVKRGKQGKIAWTKISINPNQKGQFEIKGRSLKSADQLQDSTDNKLYFGLYEVWSGKWKGGLKIFHAYVKESS